MTHGFPTTLTTRLVLLHCLAACRATTSATIPATSPTFVAQNVECMLYSVKSIDAQVRPQQEGPVESWMCGDMDTLNNNDDDDRFRSISFADIDSAAHLDLQDYISSSGAESGSSKLIFSEIIVTPTTATVFVPKDATIRIEDAASHERRLASSEGQLKTLVVRIVDKNNKKPDISKDDFYSTVLSTSGRSMANQYRDCSHDKLDIVPYGGGGKNTAVIDLKIDIEIEAGETQRTTVSNEAKAKIGELYDDYDLVQFCMPGGTVSAKGDTGQNWAAFAPVNGQYSYANDKGGYCGSISAWMHEVGHNIGLYHSGSDDKTDLMGASYNEQVTGFQKQCFNAAKNYQLGWYSSMQKKVDPLNFPAPSFSKTFKMVGVNDYDENEDSNKKVVIKMKDYYIGYNAKKGITNADRPDADKIFIVKEMGNKETRKQAALSRGQSHTIENYASGRDVTIKFISKTDKDVVTIEIFDDKNAPVETLPPVGNGCYEITVEVVGDNYPKDINWIIENFDTNMVLVSETGYTNKKDFANPDTRSFCLPYNTDFRFIMRDDNGDGICCRNYGDGYYRVLGQEGEVFTFGGKYNGEERSYDYELSDSFFTPPPPQSDFLADNNIFVDEINCNDNSEFRYQGKNNQDCNWVAGKDKSERDGLCETTVSGAFEIKDFCPGACLAACDDSCKNSTNKFKIDGKKFTCDTIKKNKHCDLDNDKGKSVKKLCPSVCKKNKCGGGNRRRLAFEKNNAGEETSNSSLRGGQLQR